MPTTNTTSVLTVQHPSRPRARGRVIDPITERDYLAGPERLYHLPVYGELVNVVTASPRLERQSFGPPKCTGYDFPAAGGAGAVWRVIRSPWVWQVHSAPGAARNERRRAANVVPDPKGGFFYTSFRLQAFDAETGEGRNQYLDVDVTMHADVAHLLTEGTVETPHSTFSCTRCADNAQNAEAMAKCTGSVACTSGEDEHAARFTRKPAGS